MTLVRSAALPERRRLQALLMVLVLALMMMVAGVWQRVRQRA